MHTQAELTHADHVVLVRLARRAYTDKSFRVCRAMQEHDSRDAARMSFDMRNGLAPAARAAINLCAMEW